MKKMLLVTLLLSVNFFGFGAEEKGWDSEDEEKWSGQEERYSGRHTKRFMTDEELEDACSELLASITIDSIYPEDFEFSDWGIYQCEECFVYEVKVANGKGKIFVKGQPGQEFDKSHEAHLLQIVRKFDMDFALSKYQSNRQRADADRKGRRDQQLRGIVGGIIASATGVVIGELVRSGKCAIM